MCESKLLRLRLGERLLRICKSKPIDQGYHRLLWILPYSLAGLAAAGLAVVARKWATERGAQTVMSTATAADAGLQQRLDDELRDLD